MRERVNDGAEDAIFLASSAEPVLRALSFAVKHGRAKSGEMVLLDSAVQPRD